MKIWTRDKELIEAGCQPYYLGTTWMWFRHDGEAVDMSEVDVERIDYAVALLIEKGHWTGQPLVVDIENWSPSEHPKECADNLWRAAARLKTIAPGWPVGVYSMLPQCNYWGPVKWLHRLLNGAHANIPSEQKEIDEWRKTNDRLAKRIAGIVDFVMPSVYAMYPANCNCGLNLQAWRYFADETIREANRVSDGKPVVPIIMTHYGDGTPVEASKWDAMVDWLRYRTDIEAIAIHTYDGMPAPEGWRVRLKKILETSALDHAPSSVE